ncbi:MAG: 2-isopropylmalate synthase [Bacteroidota bacterium]
MDKRIDENKVVIFDTTLRDGEQTPGVSLSQEAKKRIASDLQNLGVDVIEAGFPASSEGDFAGVKAVADFVTKSQVAALARATKADIDRAWEAIENAVNPRIHVFISTSDIHLEVDGMDKQKVLDAVEEAISYARTKTENVQFSAQDASRSDKDFVCEVFELAILSGATTVNMPDTVGYAVPEEFAELTNYVVQNTPSLKSGKAILSVHCHNDLGMATANTLSAIRQGARQVEVTINGIGERAGNTSLEEVVMALQTKVSIYKVETEIDTTKLVPTSKFVSMQTGVVVQPNKAIVGTNAFAHESGIHQDKMRGNPLAYEIMQPEMVGWSGERYVLGKHSGRGGLSEYLSNMGYNLTDTQLKKVSDKVKALSDSGKKVTEEDVDAIVADSINGIPEVFQIKTAGVSTGTGILPNAAVKFSFQGKEISSSDLGNGPVDAAIKAILKEIGMPIKLERYNIVGINGGSDALAGVIVRLTCNGLTAIGKSVKTDVVLGSIEAMANGINHLMHQIDNPKAIGTQVVSHN